MKIWAISDTHGKHSQLIIPEGIDTVIHAGDSTNHYGVENNKEFVDFIGWFKELPIKNKILIPGNHDEWALKKYNVDYVRSLGATLLIHEYLILDGITFFGSPYTPVFGNWHFMISRDKLNRYWDILDDTIDILITHGPPKGILDLGHDKQNNLEYCGDSALYKKIVNIQPTYHIFGHIHNQEHHS